MNNAFKLKKSRLTSVLSLFIRIFSFRTPAYIICTIWTGLSLLLEVYLSSRNMFANSGAIWTLAGIILSINHTMIFHQDIPDDSKYQIIHGGGGFAADHTEEGIKLAERRLADEAHSLLLIVIGTILMGYGTYLLPLMQPYPYPQ